MKDQTYEVLAKNGDYRLVSDPECHWHVQCISTAAWYTEASGGWCDDAQTSVRYHELVAQYFPEHADQPIPPEDTEESVREPISHDQHIRASVGEVDY